MAKQNNELKLMGTKEYIKKRNAHNTWWGKVCSEMVKGKSYNDALKAVNSIKTN